MLLLSPFGGGEWIRTTEVVDNRFTVCPLWPLGNSPINYEVLYKACPAFLSGRTAQFGAGERTRTPDLLITNSVGSVHWVIFGSFRPFPATHTDGFQPYLLNYFHTVFPRVGRGVGQPKHSRQTHKPAPTNTLKICAA